MESLLALCSGHDDGAWVEGAAPPVDAFPAYAHIPLRLPAGTDEQGSVEAATADAAAAALELSHALWALKTARLRRACGMRARDLVLESMGDLFKGKLLSNALLNGTIAGRARASADWRRCRLAWELSVSAATEIACAAPGGRAARSVPLSGPDPVAAATDGQSPLQAAAAALQSCLDAEEGAEDQLRRAVGSGAAEGLAVTVSAAAVVMARPAAAQAGPTPATHELLAVAGEGSAGLRGEHVAAAMRWSVAAPAGSAAGAVVSAESGRAVGGGASGAFPARGEGPTAAARTISERGWGPATLVRMGRATQLGAAAFDCALPGHGRAGGSEREAVPASSGVFVRLDSPLDASGGGVAGLGAAEPAADLSPALDSGRGAAGAFVSAEAAATAAALLPFLRAVYNVAPAASAPSLPSHRRPLLVSGTSTKHHRQRLSPGDAPPAGADVAGAYPPVLLCGGDVGGGAEVVLAAACARHLLGTAGAKALAEAGGPAAAALEALAAAARAPLPSASRGKQASHRLWALVRDVAGPEIGGFACPLSVDGEVCVIASALLAAGLLPAEAAGSSEALAAAMVPPPLPSPVGQGSGRGSGEAVRFAVVALRGRGSAAGVAAAALKAELGAEGSADGSGPGSAGGPRDAVEATSALSVASSDWVLTDEGSAWGPAATAPRAGPPPGGRASVSKTVRAGLGGGRAAAAAAGRAGRAGSDEARPDDLSSLGPGSRLAAHRERGLRPAALLLLVRVESGAAASEAAEADGPLQRGARVQVTAAPVPWAAEADAAAAAAGGAWDTRGRLRPGDLAGGGGADGLAAPVRLAGTLASGGLCEWRSCLCPQPGVGGLTPAVASAAGLDPASAVEGRARGSARRGGTSAEDADAAQAAAYRGDPASAAAIAGLCSACASVRERAFGGAISAELGEANPLTPRGGSISASARSGGSRASHKAKGRSGRQVAELLRFLPRGLVAADVSTAVAGPDAEAAEALLRRAEEEGCLPAEAPLQSSWLVHELGSGKLAATVDRFFAREAAAAADRHGVLVLAKATGATASEVRRAAELLPGSGVGSGGGDAGRPARELSASEREAAGLTAARCAAALAAMELQEANEVLRLERLGTGCLEALADSGVYPGAELERIHAEFERLSAIRERVQQDVAKGVPPRWVVEAVALALQAQQAGQRTGRGTGDVRLARRAAHLTPVIGGDEELLARAARVAEARLEAQFSSCKLQELSAAAGMQGDTGQGDIDDE